MRQILKQILLWLMGMRHQDNRYTGKKRGLTEKQAIARGVKQFFRQNYELRYNVMKQAEEFRPKNVTAAREKIPASRENVTAPRENATAAGDGWQQLTDRDLRRMAIEQMEQVGVAWSIDVEQYVRSNLVSDYNPIHDYLMRCGQWDGQTDYIDQLARRVPTTYAEWPKLFRRWLLAMVAQWLEMSRDYGNALMPMLIGGQGTHKSTFCRKLLPPELREYYIDDIKLDNAEQVERMLGRMLLVNIDEYNAKTEREQAKIKRVLTEREVQTRRMRSDQYQLRPRMASFIATTNDRQPLTDPTGSRRYLCCEINGIIDTDTPIDYRQLYAQVQAELKNGACWYLSKQEEQELERHNQTFRIETSPEQVLLAWYEPAPRCKDNFVRTVDIMRELELHTSKTNLPSIKLLTMALKSCGFPYGKIGDQRGWYARPKSIFSHI